MTGMKIGRQRRGDGTRGTVATGDESSDVTSELQPTPRWRQLEEDEGEDEDEGRGSVHGHAGMGGRRRERWRMDH